MRTTLLAALAAMSLSCSATELPDCFKTFSVGLLEYGYMHIAREHIGIDDDLLAELKRRSGCNFEFHDSPRVRQLAMVRTGQLDIGMSSIYAPERAQYGHYVFYAAGRNKVVLRNDARVTSLTQFLANPKLRLGIVRGSRHGEVYDALIEQLRAEGRIDESADQKQLYPKLKAGRFHALLALPVSYSLLIKQHELGGMVNVQDWAPTEPLRLGGMLFSKAVFSEEQARRWQALVDAIRADGTMKAILGKYLAGPDVADSLRY
ncbi:transporter substrate-binding domain-containing protein [Oxalobacteraceae bacterium]|nr:transporter substrate-binding domain-containing protein [Oxalobacteraceae bacterium]